MARTPYFVTILKVRLSDYLLPAATLVISVILWEVIVDVFRVPKYLIPAPTTIAEEIWEWRYRLPGQLWVTFYEAIAGFVLSILIAIPLAVALVYSALLSKAVYPLLVITQSVPKIAIAPVLLLMLGAGTESKIVLCFLAAFFPIVIDTATGLAATPEELLDLSRSYRASAIKTFMKVRFPMALPFVFSGLKIAITLSVTGAVVAEFVASDKGLGYTILAATSFWRAGLAFGAMVLLAILAVVLFGLVWLAERILCPWYADKGH
jgi:NitT/TauT family transport system permease protein